MGLDNGICVRRNEKSMNIYDKLKHYEEEWDKTYEYDFDICYWRKCYNLRTLVSKAIGGIEDCGYTPLKREDIPKIIAVLKSLNADNWDDNGGSIWEWEDHEEINGYHIEDLEYLYELMGEHDLDVYFYDSY